jgi:hypothetical protein
LRCGETNSREISVKGIKRRKIHHNFPRTTFIFEIIEPISAIEEPITTVEKPLSALNNLFECFERFGNIAVLRWALDNGCSWSSSTCVGAAQGGHFEILKRLGSLKKLHIDSDGSRRCSVARRPRDNGLDLLGWMLV